MGLLRLVCIFLLMLYGTVVEAGGSIVGKVRFRGDPPTNRTLAIVTDINICGTSQGEERWQLSKKGEVAQVVVSLYGDIRYGRSLDLTNRPVIDQKGCRFTPRVVLVPAGVPLTVRNSDKLLHQLGTMSRSNPSVGIMQAKSNKEVKLVFQHPETFPLSCDMHPWMQAWVVVMNHPYYAVTDGLGDFRLTDVPAGVHTLTAWHEVLGWIHKRIVVREGQTTPADILYISK